MIDNLIRELRLLVNIVHELDFKTKTDVGQNTLFRVYTYTNRQILLNQTQIRLY